MEKLMCSKPIFFQISILKLCLDHNTIKEKPMDTFCLQFFWRGWVGGQDTPRYTHLKSKKGYFSEDSICWEDTGYEVVSR